MNGNRKNFLPLAGFWCMMELTTPEMAIVGCLAGIILALDLT